MKSRLLSSRGMSFVEPLIMIGMLSILFVPASTIIAYCAGKLKVERAAMSRVRLMDNLMRIAGMPSALRASALATPNMEPYNGYFNVCAFQRSTIDYPKCWNRNADGRYFPFRLYFPVTSNITKPDGSIGFTTSGAVTGVPDRPMRFNGNGEPCDTTSSECPTSEYPMEAFTEFLPLCPSPIEAWRYGWTNIRPSGPLYPHGLDPIDECWSAKYIKIKVTVRASDPASAVMPITKIVTMDVNFVIHARQ